MKKSILFLTVRNAHCKEIESVKQELKREGWTVKHFHFEKMYERVERFLARWRKRSLTAFYEKPKIQESSRFKKRLYHYIAVFLSGLSRLFRTELPNVLVVLTTSPPCKIAAEVYARHKLPTALLMHTGVAGRLYDAKDFEGFSKVGVVSDHVKQTLVDCGIPEWKITVTGRPSNDVYANNSFDKNSICNSLGLDPSSRIITYLTENVPETSFKIVDHLCGICWDREWQCVVKVHPSENPNLYFKIPFCRVLQDYPLGNLLFISDVLVNTGLSSTVLDALAFKKNVVIVNLSGLPEPFPYVESGATIGVTRLKDLEGAILEAFELEENPFRDRFVVEHAYKQDGLATVRTVSLLKEALERLDYDVTMRELDETWRLMATEESRERNPR